VNDDAIVGRGARVLLRHKRAADAPDDYRWRTDPEVTRYDGTAPLTISYADFLGLHAAELSYSDHRRQVFAIDTHDGLHIGNLMYYNADAGRGEAEIGVSIGEVAFRGQGYGTEALVVFVDYLWTARQFQRLVLHTYEWNERARASFVHAGFKPVARVVRGGAALIRMEARRDEWSPQTGNGGQSPQPEDVDQRRSTVL